MIYVFIALIVSLLCKPIANIDLIEINAFNYDYVIYRSSKAFVYLLPAFASVIVGYNLVKSNENFSGILVCALGLCMSITAIFNLSMINSEMYYFLKEIKSGPGFSWSSIYSSVEIIIAVIVGGHGLSYLAHMGDFTDRRVKAPINPDLDHWTGKYK